MTIRNINDLTGNAKPTLCASFSLETNGSVPIANSIIVAPSSASKRILLLGWTITCFAGASSTTGDFRFTDGEDTGSNDLLKGMHMGTTPVVNSLSLSNPIVLTKGATLMLQATESSGQFFISGTAYYIEL